MFPLAQFRFVSSAAWFCGLAQKGELPIPGPPPVHDTSASASEDFASIAEKVPSVFMYLSAGYMDEWGDAIAHDPKVQFNEDVCPTGTACLAHCAGVNSMCRWWLFDRRYFEVISRSSPAQHRVR